MKILGIDSATAVASVALVSEGSLLGESTYNLEKTHSEKLMPMIDSLLALLETEPKELEGIAVAAGPGSFTGLRIGLATAKGLAYSLDKPLAGINTLDSLAYNVKGMENYICPLISARRGECYTAVYNREAVCLTDYTVLDIGGIKKLFDDRGWKTPLFLGDGALICKEQLEYFFPGHKIAGPGNILNRGSSVAFRAQDKLLGSFSEDIYTLEPFYIRPSGAERKRGMTGKEGKRP